MKKNIEAENQSMKQKSHDSGESKTGYNDRGNASKLAAEQSTRNKN